MSGSSTLRPPSGSRSLALTRYASCSGTYSVTSRPSFPMSYRTVEGFLPGRLHMSRPMLFSEQIDLKGAARADELHEIDLTDIPLARPL